MSPSTTQQVDRRGLRVSATITAAVLALVAALLNATTGFSLGCEMYLTFRRIAPLRTA